MTRRDFELIVPRLPVPQHDHYARLVWPDLLGGGEEIIGPFATVKQAKQAVAKARAPYPGSHQPSAHLYAVEVQR